MAHGYNTYTHDNATAPGIAQAHTVYGGAVSKSLRPEMAIAGTAQQRQSSFRDYQPPKRRAHDNGHALCSEEGCKAYPMEDKSYCAGHARVHGEMKVCAKRDCKAAPKKGTDFCRWHGSPDEAD
jgi:hypothetical protein